MKIRSRKLTTDHIISSPSLKEFDCKSASCKLIKKSILHINTRQHTHKYVHAFLSLFYSPVLTPQSLESNNFEKTIQELCDELSDLKDLPTKTDITI